jgi:rhodanese-related sulfurtransferase
LVGLFVGIIALGVQAKDTANNRPQIQNSLGFGAYLSILASILITLFTLDTQTLSQARGINVNISGVEAAINDSSVQIIDARPAFQYEMGHIPGAVNIPYNTPNLEIVMQKSSLVNKVLIVYCSSKKCNAANVLAEKLLIQGYSHIKVYPGGWQEWRLSNNLPKL